MDDVEWEAAGGARPKADRSAGACARHRVCGAWLLVLLSSIAPAARADSSDAVRARDARLHYETGMAHYQLEEWDAAISEFEAGFRVKPAPEFLFNIAQAYRFSQRPEKAIAYYRKYLRMRPDAPNRAAVDAYIEQLHDSAESPAEAQPVKPEPSPPPGAEPPAPSSAPPTAPSAPAAARSPELTLTRSKNERAPAARHVYQKGWFWGVITGSAVLVAGAVTLGIVLGARNATTVLPPADAR